VVLLPLDKLGADRFEAMAQALIKTVIGPGTTTFGAGRDGARAATFEGSAPYPSLTERWSGKWIFQAKFHDVGLLGMEKARQQVMRELRDELTKITEKYEYDCQNYILITNVSLSSVFHTGTIDRIDNEVKPDFAHRIPNIHVWGAEDITRLLEVNDSVRRAYNEMLLPGDVIADLLTGLSLDRSELTVTIRSFLTATLLREQYAQLDQAGDVSDDPVKIQQVFFDLQV
jgi:hypothetical protein